MMANHTPNWTMARKQSACHGDEDPNDIAPLLPEETPSPWVSTSGVIAHPEAPTGAGGPGFFRTAGQIDSHGNRSITLLHPSTLAGRQHLLKEEEHHRLALNQAIPLQRNKAPTTKIKSLKINKTINKTVNQKVVSTVVDVTVSILADQLDDTSITKGKATTGPDASQIALKFPTASTDNATGKIISETGKATYQGTITIRTNYRPGANKNKKSAYGRGTTKSDVTNGDVTMGFHEKCHRDDLFDWYTKKEFPAFGGHVGMSIKDYQEAQQALEDAWDDFQKAASQNTYDLTDDVGNPTEARFNAGS
jgi:hypothetical protein